MKLHTKKISALDRAAESARIVGHANRLVHQRRAITVRVIHKRLRRQTGEQPRARRGLERVPAHVRHFVRLRKTCADTAHRAKSGHCVILGTALEQPLQTYADAEKGYA